MNTAHEGLHKQYFDKGILDFLIFPDHQDSLDVHGNVVCTYHDDLRAMFFLMSEFKDQYHPLDWYPSDFDPAKWGREDWDIRKIRQRTELWKKIRFSFTLRGSEAHLLLGFFVPKPSERAWKFREEKKFTEEELKNMQVGTQSEDICIIVYLHAFPNAQFHEQGLWSARHGWAASPDGIAVFPEDGDRYVLEFKTSQLDCDFKAYYVPQIYMEMLMTGIDKCHLIRFNAKEQKMRFFEIFLDKAHFLPKMKYLWERALRSDPEDLQTMLVHDTEYKSFRGELYSFARDLKPFYEVELQKNHRLRQRIEKYHEATEGQFKGK